MCISCTSHYIDSTYWSALIFMVVSGLSVLHKNTWTCDRTKDQPSGWKTPAAYWSTAAPTKAMPCHLTSKMVWRSKNCTQKNPFLLHYHCHFKKRSSCSAESLWMSEMWGWSTQYDGASCDGTKVFLMWIRDDHDVLAAWPWNSPDLDPIKNPWSVLIISNHELKLFWIQLLSMKRNCNKKHKLLWN